MEVCGFNRCFIRAVYLCVFSVMIVVAEELNENDKHSNMEVPKGSWPIHSVLCAAQNNAPVLQAMMN